MYTCSEKQIPTIVYIHTYTHMHINMHTCIPAHPHSHMHTCTPTFTHAYMYTRIHTRMHTCMHSSMHACTHTHTHKCLYTYIMYIDTYKISIPDGMISSLPVPFKNILDIESRLTSVQYMYCFL